MGEEARGVNPTDIRVLRELQRFRGLPLKVLDLREMTGLETFEINAALARLEGVGLVARKRDHKNRVAWYDPEGELL